MKRHHIKSDCLNGHAWIEPMESEKGEWVKAEEAEAEIAKLKAEIERLKCESGALLLEIERLLRQ